MAYGYPTRYYSPYASAGGIQYGVGVEPPLAPPADLPAYAGMVPTGPYAPAAARQVAPAGSGGGAGGPSTAQELYQYGKWAKQLYDVGKSVYGGVPSQGAYPSVLQPGAYSLGGAAAGTALPGLTAGGEALAGGLYGVGLTGAETAVLAPSAYSLGVPLALETGLGAGAAGLGAAGAGAGAAAAGFGGATVGGAGATAASSAASLAGGAAGGISAGLVAFPIALAVVGNAISSYFQGKQDAKALKKFMEREVPRIMQAEQRVQAARQAGTASPEAEEELRASVQGLYDIPFDFPRLHGTRGVRQRLLQGRQGAYTALQEAAPEQVRNLSFYGRPATDPVGFQGLLSAVNPLAGLPGGYGDIPDYFKGGAVPAVPEQFGSLGQLREQILDAPVPYYHAGGEMPDIDPRTIRQRLASSQLEEGGRLEDPFALKRGMAFTG
jgi:hypothetical protein